ncbi:MAG: hypothetical protein QXJ21_06635 [Thermofilum sp.]
MSDSMALKLSGERLEEDAAGKELKVTWSISYLPCRELRLIREPLTAGAGGLTGTL